MSRPTSTVTDEFSSTDSNRNARSLKHARHVKLDGPLRLQSGGVLPEITVAYETYGQLSPARDNAVLVCHAISGDSHVAKHDETDDPGWWDIAVGSGKPIDTDKYFVICPNILGGCRGTTGPNSVDPQTRKPYGTSFPVITVGDMVEVQRQLVEKLGIERLLAVVGGSLGGHNVFTWAALFPDRVRGAIALATSPRLTSQALAFDIVARNAILQDPAYRDGRYCESGNRPAVGLAIARMLGHITYLSREAMMQKFDAHRLNPRDVQTQFETKFAVGSYLAYQGDRFVERFDANSYLTLTMAIDLFDLGDTPEKLAQTFSQTTCRWLLMSFSSDWLFPPFQSRQVVDALIADGKPVTYCNVESDCGHDAFLLSNNLATYGELMRAFLGNLRDQGQEAKGEEADRQSPVASPAPGSPPLSPSSIFRHHRIDYDSIIELIAPGASVLDLGCGTGGLLARLRQRGHRRLLGVEIDEQAILACVRRGIDVIHADINRGLPTFTDQQFDYVILSQTLQAVTDVERVLDDMLRIGRRGIVSFPNVAYRGFCERLAATGRVPRLHGASGYSWHNTPNVRFLSIADFEDFCRDRELQIDRRVALDTQSGAKIDVEPNFNADVGIFVLLRRQRHLAQE
jgi:homoserine O-acetyltransferase/O-succinyltransferase